MAFDLYKARNARVKPVEDMLTALVELNHYALLAAEAGWNVKFTIDDQNENVVAVVNFDQFPDLRDPEEAA